MLRRLSSPLLSTTQTILNAHPKTFRIKHVPGYPAPRLLFSLGLNLARPLVLQPSFVAASGSRSKIFYKHVFAPTTHLPYAAVLVCRHCRMLSLTTCSSSRLAGLLLRSPLPVYYTYFFCYTIWIHYKNNPMSTHSLVLNRPSSVEYCMISQLLPLHRRTKIARICWGQTQIYRDLFLLCARTGCRCLRR